MSIEPEVKYEGFGGGPLVGGGPLGPLKSGPVAAQSVTVVLCITIHLQSDGAIFMLNDTA